MAVFALGKEVEVFAHYPGEPPIAIHFPKGWLDPNNDHLWRNWKVNLYSVARNPPPEGSTTIRVSHLTQSTLDYLGVGETASENTPQRACEALATYFGEVYAEKYQKLRSEGCDISISLKVSSATANIRFVNSVEEKLRRNLAFLPWLRPICWQVEFESELLEEARTAHLRATIYAGLSLDPDAYSQLEVNQTQRPGVEMWGNGRLFTLKDVSRTSQWAGGLHMAAVLAVIPLLRQVPAA